MIDIEARRNLADVSVDAMRHMRFDERKPIEKNPDNLRVEWMIMTMRGH